MTGSEPPFPARSAAPLPVGFRTGPGRWLAVFFLVALTSACAPKAWVSVSPDWQPQTRTTPKSQSQTATAAAATPSARAPITERDLPAATPGAAAAPPGASATAAPEKQSPQLLASMHLVEEGHRNLDQNAVDEAISLFEQAIQIDGYNGDAFFGLARAWQRRDAPQRALEFARKAEWLLQGKAATLKQVYLLEAEILEGLDDWQGAAGYRAKADGIQGR